VLSPVVRDGAFSVPIRQNGVTASTIDDAMARPSDIYFAEFLEIYSRNPAAALKHYAESGDCTAQMIDLYFTIAQAGEISTAISVRESICGADLSVRSRSRSR
jgi:aspartate 1-decarboxylase